MGNIFGKKPKFTEWDLQRLSQMTGMSTQQLKQLHQEFQSKAGRDGQLSKDEFKKFMTEQGFDTSNRVEMDRSFRAFDRDGSGKLGFEEYVSSLVLCNNNVSGNARMEYIIDTNNPTRDQGFVTPDYASEVINTMNEYWGAQMDPSQAWSALDNGSGQVAETDFIRYVSQAPEYAAYMS